MVKKLLSFGLIAVLVTCLMPVAALGAGVNSTSNYRRFQTRWEQYAADIWERSFDNPDIGANIFPTWGVYVYGHSSEGGVLYKYFNTNGSALRYRLDLYGESGNSRFDYYIVGDALFVSDLRSNFSAMSYFPGSEVLYYEFTRYVQSNGKWYQMDDFNKQANPISTPDLYTLRELDKMLVDGDPIDGNKPLVIPEFPYYGREVTLDPSSNLDTRSGPNQKYTWCGTFKGLTKVTIYYQTSKWGLVEFIRNGKWYRVYTPMNRIVASDALGVPENPEDFEYAILLNNVTPLYGPGDKYAIQDKEYSMPKDVTVKVYFQDNDYAMVEFDATQVGYRKVKRGWVPISMLSLDAVR